MGKKKHQTPSDSPSTDSPESSISLEDISSNGFDPAALDTWEDEGEAEDTEEQLSVSYAASTKEGQKKRYGLVILIILIAAAIIVLFAGVIKRRGWSDWLVWSPIQGDSEITLIDSQDGRILMTEVTGDSRRVVVETGSEASWLIVSRDDPTATNPALSPGAEQVAYLSEQSDGRIVVASVTENNRLLITSSAVEIAALQAEFSKINICSWTPIAWAPDGQRVAFFGCRELLPLSLVIVADVSGSEAILSIVPDTEVESSDQRQLRWLDESHLTVVTPSNRDSPTPVQTYPIP